MPIEPFKEGKKLAEGEEAIIEVKNGLVKRRLKPKTIVGTNNNPRLLYYYFKIANELLEHANSSAQFIQPVLARRAGKKHGPELYSKELQLDENYKTYFMHWRNKQHSSEKSSRHLSNASSITNPKLKETYELLKEIGIQPNKHFSNVAFPTSLDSPLFFELAEVDDTRIKKYIEAKIQKKGIRERLLRYLNRIKVEKNGR